MNTRLLRVVAPHFVAGAVWEQYSQWVCSDNTAPILRWMRGKSAAEVRPYLRRKGWEWEWL